MRLFLVDTYFLTHKKRKTNVCCRFFGRINYFDSRSKIELSVFALIIGCNQIQTEISGWSTDWCISDSNNFIT